MLTFDNSKTNKRIFGFLYRDKNKSINSELYSERYLDLGRPCDVSSERFDGLNTGDARSKRTVSRGTLLRVFRTRIHIKNITRRIRKVNSREIEYSFQLLILIHSGLRLFNFLQFQSTQKQIVLIKNSGKFDKLQKLPISQ